MPTRVIEVGSAPPGRDLEHEPIAKPSSSAYRASIALVLVLSCGMACQPGPRLEPRRLPDLPSKATVPAARSRVSSAPRRDPLRARESRNRPRSASATSPSRPGSRSSTRAATAPRSISRRPTAAAWRMLDYDGDGRLDLYFATTRNLPMDAPTRSMGNRLYRNRGDGTFEDTTDRAGVGFRGFTHGLAVGDVDNNGFPDLYLANLGRNVLYLNNGDGTFRDASPQSGGGVRALVRGSRVLRLRPRRRPRPLRLLLRPVDAGREAALLRRRREIGSHLLLAPVDPAGTPLPVPESGRRHVRGRDQAGRGLPERRTGDGHRGRATSIATAGSTSMSPTTSALTSCSSTSTTARSRTSRRPRARPCPRRGITRRGWGSTPRT